MTCTIQYGCCVFCNLFLYFQLTQLPQGGSQLSTQGVHANIWGPKFYVKSIFEVCEFQHGQKINVWGPVWSKFFIFLNPIFSQKCLALTEHGMQYDPEVANHEINVWYYLKTLKDQEAQIAIIQKHYRGPRNR